MSSTGACGHTCCSDADPLHDHFLRPKDCSRCAASRTSTEADDLPADRAATPTAHEQPAPNDPEVRP